jgi:replicative DNA helicase
LFLYELQSRIDDEKERDYYASEWEIIEGTEVFEDADVLAHKLQEAHTGRKIMGAAEEIVLNLEEANITDALESLKRAAVSINQRNNDDHPIREITDYKHRLELIKDKQQNPEKYLGIKTGFPTYDQRTGGLFAKELVLVAGVTGLGKSTFVKQLQHGIITENENKNVLHIANEESQEQVEMKFDSLLTEIPYLDYKMASTSDEEIEQWVNTMEQDMKKPGRGRIFVKEVPAFSDVTLVEQAYNELKEKGIDIHVIIIDHLPHIAPIGQAWGENDERAKAASDCKQLSKDCNCAVVVPTQAATEVEAKQEKGKRANKLDVYGSKGQVHVANSFLMITKRGVFEDENKPEYLWDVRWLCDMKKNRDGPPFYFEARHHVQIGKVEEISESSANAEEIDDITGEAGAALEGDEAPVKEEEIVADTVEDSPEESKEEPSEETVESQSEESPKKSSALLSKMRQIGI